MSTLDTQIVSLTAKVSTLSDKYANMATNGATQEEKTKTLAELNNLESILNNLLAIRSEQTSNNETIQNSYTTATDALNRIDALAAQSETLSSTLKADAETRKNSIKINTYYGKQYEEYKKLFIMITIVCICLIASLLLAYTPLEYLSRPLSIAVGILGGAVVAYKIIEMVLRSNMDYDEYNWVAAPVTDDGIANANNGDNKLVDISGVSLGTICVGPLCCGEGTEWNSKKGCVLLKPQNVTTTDTTTGETDTTAEDTDV